MWVSWFVILSYLNFVACRVYLDCYFTFVTKLSPYSFLFCMYRGLLNSSVIQYHILLPNEFNRISCNLWLTWVTILLFHCLMHWFCLVGFENLWLKKDKMSISQISLDQKLKHFTQHIVMKQVKMGKLVTQKIGKDGKVQKCAQLPIS